MSATLRFTMPEEGRPMADKTIQVQTLAWMKLMPNTDNLEAYLIGQVKDAPGTLAVAIKGGATRFYCERHQRIYHPLQSCPDCASSTL